MTRNTITAICRDTTDRYMRHVGVECRIVRTREGSEDLEATKEQLKADHPSLQFEDWCYDLMDADDRNTLRLFFLSPNVQSVNKWHFIDGGYVQRAIFRDEVC